MAYCRDEKAIRKALCKRAGGHWTGSYCQGGLCEECHQPPKAPDWRLHPHEEPFRSHGGKVSLEQSRMLCTVCHARKHNLKVIVDSNPQWSKEK